MARLLRACKCMHPRDERVVWLVCGVVWCGLVWFGVLQPASCFGQHPLTTAAQQAPRPPAANSDFPNGGSSSLQ